METTQHTTHTVPEAGALVGNRTRIRRDQRHNWRVLSGTPSFITNLAPGQFVIESAGTGCMLIAQVEARTDRLSRAADAPIMRRVSVRNIDTVVIDGAIWGVPGDLRPDLPMWVRADKLVQS